MKCKDCSWCDMEDGTPYCLAQDLYTHVDIEKECAENCDNDEWVVKNATPRVD